MSALAELGRGALEKMRVEAGDPVAYRLELGEATVAMNPLLGRRVALEFAGTIHCVSCGRPTRKSFEQGHCFPCFRRLASCDRCVKSPELCHYHEGTCREPAWGERNCMTDHVVYLANSTGVKVGITRASQVPVRWIDQGAVAAIPFARTATRRQAGLLEVLLKEHVTDRTQWQRLLRGDPEPVDLAAVRAELLERCAEVIAALQAEFGVQAIRPVDDAAAQQFRYPVEAWPAKVRALDLEKLGRVEGELQGIKGQYLLLSSGVLNVRKYTAYDVVLSAA